MTTNSCCRGRATMNSTGMPSHERRAQHTTPSMWPPHLSQSHGANKAIVAVDEPTPWALHLTLAAPIRVAQCTSKRPTQPLPKLRDFANILKHLFHVRILHLELLLQQLVVHQVRKEVHIPGALGLDDDRPAETHKEKYITQGVALGVQQGAPISAGLAADSRSATWPRRDLAQLVTSWGSTLSVTTGAAATRQRLGRGKLTQHFFRGFPVMVLEGHIKRHQPFVIFSARVCTLVQEQLHHLLGPCQCRSTNMYEDQHVLTDGRHDTPHLEHKPGATVCHRYRVFWQPAAVPQGHHPCNPKRTCGEPTPATIQVMPHGRNVRTALGPPPQPHSVTFPQPPCYVPSRQTPQREWLGGRWFVPPSGATCGDGSFLLRL